MFFTAAFILFVVIYLGILRVSKTADPNLVKPPFEWPRSKLYFWVVVPVLMIGGIKSVYSWEEILTRWFFIVNTEIYKSYSKILSDILFGFSFGAVLMIIFSFYEELRAKLKSKPKKVDVELPGVWVEVDPQKQINYLEKFVRDIPNKQDQESLKFWYNIQEKIKKDEMIYRGSLGADDIKKLNLTTSDKDYLAIEFWRDKNNNFIIRDTEGSKVHPRMFKESQGELGKELKRLIQEEWHSALKRNS